MVPSWSEASPNVSPCASVIVSPETPRSTSSNRSSLVKNAGKILSLPRSISSSVYTPQLLQRANSYKKTHKGHSDCYSQNTSVGRSRLRSNSTPSIVFSISGSTCVTRNCSSSYTTDDTDDSETNEENIVEYSKESKSQRKVSCSEQEIETKKCLTLSRKKSLSSIFDLKKNKIHISKITKSFSHASRLQKEALIHKKSNGGEEKEEINDEKTEVPLFQATTMFIPGYDFKTKKVTSLEEPPRRSSTPLFSRRGSKEKFQAVDPQSKDGYKEKHKTSPVLPKTQKMNNKPIENLKHGPYQRSDSLPVHVNLSGDECSVCGDEIMSDKCDECEVLSVTERKQLISQKHRAFSEFEKKIRSLDVPVNTHGKVKSVLSGFESGKPFWRRYKQKKKDEEHERKHHSCEIEHDSIFRQRAKSYESGKAFKTHCSDNEVTDSSQGSESGYNSPTDNNNTEINKNQKPLDSKKHVTDDIVCFIKPKIVLSSYEEPLSNSWSHGEWRNKKTRRNNRKVSPDISRCIATDLCMTEL